MSKRDPLLSEIDEIRLPLVVGFVTSVRENYLEADLPSARIGQSVGVTLAGGAVLDAEVVTCEGQSVGLLPMASTRGAGVGDRVRATPQMDRVPCGRGLLGRIIDPFGRPLDAGSPIVDCEPWSIFREAPDPLSRPLIADQLHTGLRCLDGCLALGKGQRLGLFAGPGAGKSTILGQLARRSDCDTSVVCLVGERGREVNEFVKSILGGDGLSRSVIVVATADSPAQVRSRACTTATAIAEWFRCRGQHVLLLVDSLTRVVRARRDVAFSAGEASHRGGYPASALSFLPGLLERTGMSSDGSITALYAVLTDEGADDPVASEVRSLLDGHIVLSSALAGSGQWPAVDLLESVSRVMKSVVQPAQIEHASTLRRIMGAHRKNEDLILMGAYRKGSCGDTDAAIALGDRIAHFLRQSGDASSPLAETQGLLKKLVSGI